MKKQATTPNTNEAGNIFSRLALASLLFFGVFTAGAQETVKYNESPLQIKYLGVVDNQPLFQVDFDNESGETYLLSIKADDGTALYTQTVKEKKFSKKIKWNNPDFDRTKLLFTLSNDKSKQSQVFEINTSLREVRDVVITKL